MVLKELFEARDMAIKNNCPHKKVFKAVFHFTTYRCKKCGLSETYNFDGTRAVLKNEC